jgi:hypothetical protein
MWEIATGSAAIGHTFGGFLTRRLKALGGSEPADEANPAFLVFTEPRESVFAKNPQAYTNVV